MYNTFKVLLDSWTEIVSTKVGLNLSKEVVWVSVGQSAAELWAVKVGGQQKILPIGPVRTRFAIYFGI